MSTMPLLRQTGLLFFLLLLGSGKLIAQGPVAVQRATLTGQVTNGSDGRPLPFARVYLNGTTRGTTADENGQFSLPEVPYGANELVVSYTGFAAVRQAIRIAELKPRPLAIALLPIANQLTDVVVTAKKDKIWLRQVEQFERGLIGTSPFARQCVLTNPDVLQFEEVNGLLSATARAPLVIDNQALGYRLTYTLHAFRSQSRTGRVVFGGTTLFSELKPDSPKQTKLWQRNRQQAYQGSLRHLLASLAAGTHEQQGFLVYQTDPARPLLSNPPPLLASEVGRHLRPFDATVLIAPGTLAHERWLVSNSPLEVFYTRVVSNESPYRDAQYAFSQLVLPQQSIGFTLAGQITAPRGFDAMGYLSNDRLATTLPDDWEQGAIVAARPDSTRTQPTQRPGADASLDSLMKRWNRESAGLAPAVFVHIDKPLYLTGDRLWLSGYVLDPQTQRCDTASFGPALAVELWSSANKLIQHQWLPVEGGRTAGAFQLADSLTSGTYWLRAYTDVDRKLPKVAFQRPLWIANRQGQPTTYTAGDQPLMLPPGTLSFEGGYVEEAPGAPYRIQLTSDSAQLIVALDSRSKTRFPAAFMLVESRGKLVHAARISARTANQTVRYSTLTWPSGTAWLSLMDSTGWVWAKRSVRVPDRAGSVVAKVTRRSAAADATPLEGVLITLQDQAGRPIMAEVSAAIVDADQVPVDSLVDSFAAYLMSMESRRVTYPTAGTVAADITLYGRVLTTEKMPVNVLVLTADRQGVVSRATQTDSNGNFQLNQLALPDTAQLIVQVTNRRGKPINASISFGNTASSFGALPSWPDAPRLLGQWRTQIEAGKQRQLAEATLYRQTEARQLQEVVVRTARPIDGRPADVRLRSLHNQVDQTIVLDERTVPLENLYYLIQARVPGIRVEPGLANGRAAYSVKFPGASSIMNAKVVAQTSFSPPPPKAPADATMQNPLFLMDGFPINDTDGTQLLAFSPSSIERIEVLKSGSIASIYGASSSRGVIAFYTKTNRDPAKSKGVSRHTVTGYANPQPFPAVSAMTDARLSLRDVLAWEPLGSTNERGQLTLSVVIPQRVRTVRITIQGVSTDGQAISCVQTLPVAALK
ncbi:carboxypeptidase regulatory-like domain-containing protein [Fibrivirga algicola]|uniref:TonB-dependent receptor plug domain-containing protein n=1 Tax=Fibrivirga algicola TaxID=2950420 RepID=A0ABX0QFA8_9BACT|nr:carboxypeptidase-like regulatory domain-containing protein [Fibrivirga algicola]NID11095.1 TonB-dependent receptor plug domain-containing protein [Fibrivirga algicola]